MGAVGSECLQDRPTRGGFEGLGRWRAFVFQGMAPESVPGVAPENNRKSRFSFLA